MAQKLKYVLIEGKKYTYMDYTNGKGLTFFVNSNKYHISDNQIKERGFSIGWPIGVKDVIQLFLDGQIEGSVLAKKKAVPDRFNIVNRINKHQSHIDNS